MDTIFAVPPFHLWIANWVYDRRGEFCFEIHNCIDSVAREIVAILNGESERRIKNLSIDGCNLVYNWKYIIVVRGWGRLVGKYKLSEQEAVEKQYSFAKELLKQLK